MTTKRVLKTGRLTALITFIFGTFLFGLYYLTAAFELIFAGYGFIALAGLVNIGVLTSILIQAGKNREYRNKLLRTGAIMLLNIPVMLAYCWVAIILMDTIRITFTNKTGAEKSNIKIIGCGSGYIEKLKVGESETIWVPITGDCSINIDYLLTGKRTQETVVGYVTSSMGLKVNHAINRQDK